MRKTLKRSEILRGRKIFSYIFQHGRNIHAQFLRCLVVRIPSPDPVKSAAGCRRFLFGVAVSRTVKRSVDRNRIKRLIRESCRLNKQLLYSILPDDTNRIAVLFVYSTRRGQSFHPPTFSDIEADVQSIIATIARQEQQSSA